MLPPRTIRGRNTFILKTSLINLLLEILAQNPAAAGTLVRITLLCVLAGLISYGAGCLACGLAGCLAFTASAFFQGILQISAAESLDMFHCAFLL